MNWQVALPWRHPPPKPVPRLPAKGDYNSTCQRFACENDSAHWYNQTNGKYYCSDCARTFNELLRHQGRRPLCELHLSR